MYPSSDVIDWIRSAAIPLATAEPRGGCADLEPLRADARRRKERAELRFPWGRCAAISRLPAAHF